MLRNSFLSLKDIIYNEKLKENMINLGRRVFKWPDSFSFQKAMTGPDFIARPDLVSHALYSDDMYGDLICKINGISNPFELNEDTLLVLPDINFLDEFYLVEDETEEKVTSKPTPKLKKDKRKANEAVITDVRYKIDNANKIIIY